MVNKSKSPFPAASDKLFYAFGSGLIYWAIVAGLFVFLGPLVDIPAKGTGDIGVKSFILLVIIVGSGFLGVHFAVRGCDFGKQYKFGTVGHLIKFFSILFTLFFIVPHLFWTGRGLLRMFLRETQIVE